MDVTRSSNQPLHEPLTEIDEIQRLRARADNKQNNWLVRRGWEHTSSTPGSYWMWRKEWEGKTFLVEEQTAARIQEHCDREADYQLHPEDYEP